MKKLVYISSIAAPHQIRLCEELQKYFAAQSWFYDSTGARASWWSIPLGKFCKIISNVKLKKTGRYVTFSHIRMLREFNPDIVMLGGFSIPANYIAYCWARINKKKTIVFTERSRTKDGTLRKYGLPNRIIRFLYRNVDMVMVAAEDTVPQLRDTFKFGNKVVVAQYASLIDDYLTHPSRDITKRLKFIFPNRLTEIYDPIKAINIFSKIYEQHKTAKLSLNAIGELRSECEKLISDLHLSDAVSFLDNIQKWEDLGQIYSESDIMIFPAKFSNGNFTIVEAMASGMGIVVSDKILGYGGLIIERQNGFNRKPTIDNFVDAINEYIKNPNLIGEHTVINRSLVNQYSVTATAKLYSDLIDNMYK